MIIQQPTIHNPQAAASRPTTRDTHSISSQKANVAVENLYDISDCDVKMVSYSRAPSCTSSRYSNPPITKSEGVSANDQFDNDTDFETNKSSAKHILTFIYFQTLYDIWCYFMIFGTT